MDPVLVTSYYCNKVPDKGNFSQVYFSLVFQGIQSSMAESRRRLVSLLHRQVAERDGSLASAHFAFLSLGSQSIEWCHPHLGWVFPHQ